MSDQVPWSSCLLSDYISQYCLTMDLYFKVSLEGYKLCLKHMRAWDKTSRTSCPLLFMSTSCPWIRIYRNDIQKVWIWRSTISWKHKSKYYKVQKELDGMGYPLQWMVSSFLQVCSANGNAGSFLEFLRQASLAETFVFKYFWCFSV